MIDLSIIGRKGRKNGINFSDNNYILKEKPERMRLFAFSLLNVSIIVNLME